MSAGLAHAVALGEIIPTYVMLRAAHPTVPAIHIVEYIKTSPGVNLDQFICRHDWVISEETDRCYCTLCGADGDA